VLCSRPCWTTRRHHHWLLPDSTRLAARQPRTRTSNGPPTDARAFACATPPPLRSRQPPSSERSLGQRSTSSRAPTCAACDIAMVQAAPCSSSPAVDNAAGVRRFCAATAYAWLATSDARLALPIPATERAQPRRCGPPECERRVAPTHEPGGLVGAQISSPGASLMFNSIPAGTSSGGRWSRYPQ